MALSALPRAYPVACNPEMSGVIIAVMSRGAEDWGVREESTCVGRGKVRAGSSDVPGGPGRLSHEVGPLL